MGLSMMGVGKMENDAEREAFDEWLPNYYTSGEDSAARSGWVAAIKHADSRHVIPEGYALVPVEPSAAILSAAFDATGASEAMRTKVNIRTLRIYRKMIASAQQATK